METKEHILGDVSWGALVWSFQFIVTGYAGTYREDVIWFGVHNLL